MKPEQKLWQLVKDHLPGVVNRVENVAGTGMPDVHGYDTSDYWLELKVQSENTEKEDVSPLALLKPSQRIWHIKRAQAGGFTLVLVRNGQRLRLYTSRGTTAILVWEDTKPWNWDSFKDTIRRLA